MAMGLHDNDVAFFLAADEPATYIQVSLIEHSQTHDAFLQLEKPVLALGT